jgi:hypothetical protein
VAAELHIGVDLLDRTIATADRHRTRVAPDAARRPASDPGRLKAPHARPRLSRRASGAAGSLIGRARGGPPRSTVAREERQHELGLHRGRRPRARRARGPR